jgi:hypothetical protein
VQESDSSLSSPNSSSNEVALECPVSEEAVESWLEHAQQQTIDEVMMEICDGRARAVRNLERRASSGTPKDLAVWECIPDSLHELLLAAAAVEGGGGGDSGNHDDDGDDDDGAEKEDSAPSAETLVTWCRRARRAVEQLEWLRWYATPITTE